MGLAGKVGKVPLLRMEAWWGCRHGGDGGMVGMEAWWGETWCIESSIIQLQEGCGIHTVD